MARETLSLSCRGTRAYIKAVKHVAATRNMEVGSLVRTAIDEYIGTEVDKVIHIFFADDTPRKEHNSSNNAKPNRTAEGTSA